MTNNKHVSCLGLIGSSKAFIVATTSDIIGGQNFIICSDKERAAYFYNDLENYYEEKEADYSKKRVLFYPTSYKRPYEPEKADNTYILSRTEVLQRLSSSDRKTIVVTYPEALSEKVITRKTMSNNTFKLSVADNISIDSLTDNLVELNFEHVDFVVEPGQFAIRGGIVDVFSFSNDYPYRIEFFGDEIDSIRSFNPIDQLSIEKLKDIILIPNLQDYNEEYERESILQFLKKQSTIWIEEGHCLEEKINNEYEKAIEVFNRLQSSSKDYNNIENPEVIFTKGDEIITQLDNFKTISFGNFINKDKETSIVFNTTPQPSFNKNFDLLLKDINNLKSEGYTVYCFSESKKQLERIQSILNDMQPKDERLKAKGKGQKDDTDFDDYFIPVNYSIQAGFIDRDMKICCYTDHQIFERYHRFRLREGFASSQALTIKELYDLKPGDYVTHINYGIGRFDGLEIIDNNGKQQEAMRLIYQNGDLLYVSIHSLHRISKYSGKDGSQPTLSKLGSNSWNKLKEKTKSRVKDIARELIKLYAERKNSKGFQFMPDTYLQTELEASFMYEDTADQLKATVDVKRDMESETPMDRLICGDVGFGKTEIAIRAAFKAVCDSKQVAVLVPTTVLALQHYQTFSKRLKGFPVNIDYINRFKTAKEQKKTIEDVKNGRIDIIIGTHSIIGKNVSFKDLGLLIIDEEQKFGVSAKEKLKQLQTNVDTLTLTATPIPRTLQFSMMGARDTSIIKTAPPNRQPVETELHTFNPEIIRDAIQYELARDGQVFFVHNRVQNIQEVCDMITTYVPGVRVGVAHGQMEGSKLEQIMLDFIDEKYDVLLSTTIIEAGLDIPNANTIIINEAQNFGLSDLHQLRGRVGRSNKKAFCYLLAPPLNILSDEARKRLRAIEDFSDLGSGFNIALRDLDIRGAGNLLGAEQSGFINDIGFETYHKILDEAILELKETEFKDIFEGELKDKKFVSDCVFESDLEILIPYEYVDSSAERISLYTELDHIQNEEGLIRFTNNLTDRFGQIPPQTEDLLNTMRLRWLARDLGFEKITLKNKIMTAYLVSNQESEYYQTDTFMKIIRYAASHQRRCKVKELNGKNILYVDAVTNVAEALKVMRETLEL
ncbi:MAG: transcription-repair coupling factor [Bacteroidales bacterium]|nr:transcription-repair coupling factor [Bacteroidales bacterium]